VYSETAEAETQRASRWFSVCVCVVNKTHHSFTQRHAELAGFVFKQPFSCAQMRFPFSGTEIWHQFILCECLLHTW